MPSRIVQFLISAIVIWGIGFAHAGNTACLPYLCVMLGDTNANGQGIPVTFESNRWIAGQHEVAFGAVGDKPVLGDWDADGKVEPAIATSTHWRVVREFSDQMIYQIDGTPPANVPVSGDWDGDGIATAGDYHNGVWTITNTPLNELRGPFNPLAAQYFGPPAAVPRDGVPIAVPIPLKTTLEDGVSVSDYMTIEFGAPDMLPVVGDWDNDGTDDFGVYDGSFFYLALGPWPSQPDAVVIPAESDGVPVSGHLGGNRGFLGVLLEWLPGDPPPPQSAIPVPSDVTPAGGSIVIIPLDLSLAW